MIKYAVNFSNLNLYFFLIECSLVKSRSRNVPWKRIQKAFLWSPLIKSNWRWRLSLFGISSYQHVFFYANMFVCIKSFSFFFKSAFFLNLVSNFLERNMIKPVHSPMINFLKCLLSDKLVKPNWTSRLRVIKASSVTKLLCDLIW